MEIKRKFMDGAIEYKCSKCGHIQYANSGQQIEGCIKCITLKKQKECRHKNTVIVCEDCGKKLTLKEE